MNSSPIVVFDSGIGGLPYLERIRELLPNEPFAYVADTAHFPYGARSDDEVIDAVVETANRINTVLSPKLLVVACNTASVLALERLRQAIPIAVVGVVPAVKPACEHTRTGVIGVLATERTVEGRYLDDLILKFCRGCRVVRMAAPELVHYVERELYAPASRSIGEVIAPYVRLFREQGADAIVLGCTHFVHVARELAALLGGRCKVVDSRDGVARQTVRLAADIPSGKAQNVRFYVTGRTVDSTHRAIAARFGLSTASVL